MIPAGILTSGAVVAHDGPGATLIHGDATHLPIEDGTVDAIITSPPYFALRSYTDDGGEHYDGQIGSEATPHEFLEALWAVTAECRRVLKPSGSLWVNLGDKYAGTQPGAFRKHTHPRNDGTDATWRRAVPLDDVQATTADVDFGGIRPKSLMGLPWRYAIGCIDDLDLILRAEVCWNKPNGLPESVTDRVRRSHEQWFHFVKEPRYFAAVDEVREPQKEFRTGVNGAERDFHTDQMSRKWNPVANAYNPLGKLPGSVWTIPSEPLKVPDHLGVDHFAAFPQEWPRRIILGWSPSGICVECGEGREPVVEKEQDAQGRTTNGPKSIDRRHESPGRSVRTVERAAITGYSCACPTPDAPTRPAVILDPFGGTGTTAGVARMLGRHGLHVDLSRDYLRLAKWRIWDSGHFAKAAARTAADRQLDLFGGAA